MPIVIGDFAGTPVLHVRELAGGGFAVRLLVAQGANKEGALVRIGAEELVAEKRLEPRFLAVLTRLAADRPLVRRDFLPMGALAAAGLLEAVGPGSGKRWAPSALGHALLRVHARTKAQDVRCSLCGTPGPKDEAHRHQGAWIGDACCWDERLKASE